MKKMQAGLALGGIACCALALIQCGPNAIPLAGGASEVGNPSSALYDDGGSDTASRGVNGVEIRFNGPPVRLLREIPKPAADSAISEVPSDSPAHPELP